MTTKTTVAIAVPLEAELVERIRAVDPSVTVLYEPELLPPERFPADHSGDPEFRRTPEQEERYWDMLNKAQVLYGFPNESPAGLARIAAQQSPAGVDPRHGGRRRRCREGIGAGRRDAAEVQGHHLGRGARPAARRVRRPRNPQRLQAQRGTGTGPGGQGLARAPHPHPAGQRLPPGGHRTGRDRARDRTDRPRPGHERQRHQADRGAHRRASRRSRTTTASPACWARQTPSSTPFPARRTPRSSSAAKSSPP